MELETIEEQLCVKTALQYYADKDCFSAYLARAKAIWRRQPGYCLVKAFKARNAFDYYPLRSW